MDGHYWVNKDFLAGVGITFLVVPLLLFIAKNWFLVRLKESIHNEYAIQLEEIKSTLIDDRNYRESVLVADRRLYSSFLELLPSTDCIRVMKEHDMGVPIEISELNPLEDFSHEWDNVEHEFLDEELNTLLFEFREAVGEFRKYFSINTFPLKTDTKRNGVPREWRDQREDMPLQRRYWETCKELNRLADNVVTAHEKLVKTARIKLAL